MIVKNKNKKAKKPLINIMDLGRHSLQTKIKKTIVIINKALSDVFKVGPLSNLTG